MNTPTQTNRAQDSVRQVRLKLKREVPTITGEKDTDVTDQLERFEEIMEEAQYHDYESKVSELKAACKTGSPADSLLRIHLKRPEIMALETAARNGTDDDWKVLFHSLCECLRSGCGLTKEQRADRALKQYSDCRMGDQPFPVFAEQFQKARYLMIKEGLLDENQPSVMRREIHDFMDRCSPTLSSFLRLRENRPDDIGGVISLAREWWTKTGADQHALSGTKALYISDAHALATTLPSEDDDSSRRPMPRSNSPLRPTTPGMHCNRCESTTHTSNDCPNELSANDGSLWDLRDRGQVRCSYVDKNGTFCDGIGHVRRHHVAMMQNDWSDRMTRGRGYSPSRGDDRYRGYSPSRRFASPRRDVSPNDRRRSSMSPSRDRRFPRSDHDPSAQRPSRFEQDSRQENVDRSSTIDRQPNHYQDDYDDPPRGRRRSVQFRGTDRQPNPRSATPPRRSPRLQELGQSPGVLKQLRTIVQDTQDQTHNSVTNSVEPNIHDDETSTYSVHISTIRSATEDDLIDCLMMNCVTPESRDKPHSVATHCDHTSQQATTSTMSSSTCSTHPQATASSPPTSSTIRMANEDERKNCLTLEESVEVLSGNSGSDYQVNMCTPPIPESLGDIAVNRIRRAYIKMAFASVGNQRVRVVFDNGAAVCVCNAELAESLRSNQATKSAYHGSIPLPHPVRLGGFSTHQHSADIHYVHIWELTFRNSGYKSSATETTAKQKFMFVELPGFAEEFLLSSPSLDALGFQSNKEEIYLEELDVFFPTILPQSTAQDQSSAIANLNSVTMLKPLHLTQVYLPAYKERQVDFKITPKQMYLATKMANPCITSTSTFKDIMLSTGPLTMESSIADTTFNEFKVQVSVKNMSDKLHTPDPADLQVYIYDHPAHAQCQNPDHRSNLGYRRLTIMDMPKEIFEMILKHFLYHESGIDQVGPSSWTHLDDGAPVVINAGWDNNRQPKIAHTDGMNALLKVSKSFTIRVLSAYSNLVDTLQCNSDGWNHPSRVDKTFLNRVHLNHYIDQSARKCIQRNHRLEIEFADRMCQGSNHIFNIVDANEFIDLRIEKVTQETPTVQPHVVMAIPSQPINTHVITVTEDPEGYDTDEDMEDVNTPVYITQYKRAKRSSHRVTFNELEQEINKRNFNKEDFPYDDLTSFEYKQALLQVIESRNLIATKHPDARSLTSQEHQAILDLVLEFSDVFWIDGARHSTVTGAQCRIETGNAAPVRLPPYHLSPYDQTRLEFHLDRLEKAGYISDLPPGVPCDWGFPCFVVDKPSDILGRMVIDYRKLNERTLRNPYPMRLVDQCLDELGSSVIYTSMDAVDGFWQIPLHPDHRYKTAMVCHLGIKVWNVLPQGVTNGPQDYQGVSDDVFREAIIDGYLVNYMDDNIVHSGDFHSHLEHLRNIFSMARQRNLLFKATKCLFAQHQCKFIGHVVDRYGKHPDPDKIKCLQQWPVPETKEDVKSFFAFANYLRGFMPRFVKDSQPLRKFLKTVEEDRTIVFQDDAAAVQAFEKLKTSICQDAVLVRPDFDAAYRYKESGRPFEEYIDACDYGVAVTLAQKDATTLTPRPIAIMSKSLSPVQNRWTTWEKELYAIIWAQSVLYRYVKGFHRFVYMDHKNNLNLDSVAPSRSPKKIHRWAIELSEHDITRVWITGRANILGDAPSRNPTDRDIVRQEANRTPTSDPILSLIKQFLMPPPGVVPQSVEFPQPIPCQDACAVVANTMTMNVSTEQGAATGDTCLDILKASDLPVVRSDMSHDSSLKTDRMLLFEAQLADSDFGDIIRAHHLAHESQLDVTHTSVRSKLSTLFGDRKRANVAFNQARHYQIVCSLLYRKVPSQPPNTDPYDLVAVIPRGGMQTIHVEDNQEYKTTWRRYLIFEHHNAPYLGGHTGRNKTLGRLQSRFWWPGMNKDVRKWCQRCFLCRSRKGIPSKTASLNSKMHDSPFRTIVIDTVGEIKPESSKGNKYIFSVIDPFSHFLITSPIPNKQAETIAKHLMFKVLLQYGCPEVICSDNGTEFVNKVVEEMNSLLSVKHVFGSSYHPEAQYPVERIHRFINALLSIYVTRSRNPTQWDDQLAVVDFAFNSTPIEDMEGLTPFMITRGYNPRFPFDVVTSLPKQRISPMVYARTLMSALKQTHDLVNSIIKELKEQSQHRADLMYRHNDLNVGDAVLLQRPRDSLTMRLDEAPQTISDRLIMRNDGPFIVSRKASDTLFYLCDPDTKSEDLGFKQPIHANRLVPFDLPKEQLGGTTSSSRQTRIVMKFLNDDNVPFYWPGTVIERSSRTGKVKVEWDSGDDSTWHNLDEEEYQWLD